MQIPANDPKDQDLREAAAQAEQENPHWIVVFGSYTRIRLFPGVRGTTRHHGNCKISRSASPAVSRGGTHNADQRKRA
jgi:hypothetical protein